RAGLLPARRQRREVRRAGGARPRAAASTAGRRRGARVEGPQRVARGPRRGRPRVPHRRPGGRRRGDRGGPRSAPDRAGPLADESAVARRQRVVNDPGAPSQQPREATARALATGAAIGVVLAAANVYTSIKVGIIDGGGITAVLLAFGVFAVLGRR